MLMLVTVLHDLKYHKSMVFAIMTVLKITSTKDNNNSKGCQPFIMNCMNETGKCNNDCQLAILLRLI